jgi:hypothetical protein
MLAWQLRAHADPARPSAYRLAVRLGLNLTFVFGAGIGMLLSGLQPPDAGATTLPVFGWSLQGGDLRPAHFIGIHAGQVLPLAGFWFARRAANHAPRAVWGFTAGYAALFAAAVAFGLFGPFGHL